MSPDLSIVPHITNTAQPMPAPLRRVAIIGTAESWKACPWQDTSLEVWGLNDAYLIGVPRADRWYDLHPVHQMLFRTPGQALSPDNVPIGTYVRPHGHLDWLKSRPMPVFVQKQRADWPTSRAFPKEAVLEFFAQYWPLRLSRQGTIVPGDDYEVSTPSWMLMQAIMEGYQEIHVYGIHLATEWEYVQQRPNFEFLLGIAAGRGVKVILPAATPICRANYRYAFEPKADLGVQRAEYQINKLKQDGLRLKQQLAGLPWYARAEKKFIQDRLFQMDVQLADLRQVQGRARLAMEAK